MLKLGVNVKERKDGINATLSIDNSDAGLFILPNELLANIGNCLTKNHDKFLASRSCLLLHTLFQPDLDKLAQEQATQLCLHVVKGEEKEARAMLEKNAGLVLIEVELSNKANQRIRGTAFKMALGAVDKSMCTMISPYFKKLANGDEERTKQINEQFPNSYHEHPLGEYDFNALAKLIAADPLLDGEMNEVTFNALQIFREFVLAKSTEVITTGKHFDIQIFINAVENSEEIFYSEEHRTKRAQRSLYAQKVLGLLESLFPACDAQAVCQGLYNVMVLKQPLVRCLEFCRQEDGSFYANGLGDSHYVVTHRYGFRQVNAGEREWALDTWQDYANEKNDFLQSLLTEKDNKNLMSSDNCSIAG